VNATGVVRVHLQAHHAFIAALTLAGLVKVYMRVITSTPL